MTRLRDISYHNCICCILNMVIWYVAK